MSQYSLLSGDDPVLPPFVGGCQDLITTLYPPDQHVIAAVQAPVDTNYCQCLPPHSVPPDTLLGEMRIGHNEYHIVIGPYLEYTVSSSSVRTPHQRSPGDVFELTGYALDPDEHLGASLLVVFWRSQGWNVTPLGLKRLRPAHIIGQLPQDFGPAPLATDKGMLNMTGGRYVVREQTGEGVRLPSRRDLSREFPGACLRGHIKPVVDFTRQESPYTAQ